MTEEVNEYMGEDVKSCSEARVGLSGGEGWVESVGSGAHVSGDNELMSDSIAIPQYGITYDYNNPQIHDSQTISENISVVPANEGSVGPVGQPTGDYNEYYNYYANYYQHYQNKTEIPANDFSQSTELVITSCEPLVPRLRSDDNKGLTDGNRDDDEEEGQIVSSPHFSKRKPSRRSHTPPTPVDYSGRNSAHNSRKSSSRSKSKDTSNRSRSPSRKRYVSRSRSRSRSRRRRRSRSRSRSRTRSPYFGPIIKDYRRGRRGFVRYPRGFRDRGVRPFNSRGNQSQYGYGGSRRHDLSRSRSRSVSPKRKHTENEKRKETTAEEKAIDSKNSETLKPSDIKDNEKRLTQTFLAMLEEKHNKSKMIPQDHSFETTRNDSIESDDNRQHGFVNTFNNVREMEAKKHMLSYDLEREGWQVIDDANSESSHRRRNAKDGHKKDDKPKQLETKESVGHEKVSKAVKVEPISGDIEKSNKKKKSSKRKKRKKSSSTSTDSSDSESDIENEDNNEINDKKSKKKRKSKKKNKKKVVSSSSSSEDDTKQKKKSRSKRADTSSDSENEHKEDKDLTQKLSYETNTLDEKTVLLETEELSKTNDKKKKKRKTKEYDSSDSDLDNKKKRKKKRSRKKSSKRRKRRSSSSSSSSDSSDSSDSEDRKKRKRKHKKKSKKHRKDSKKVLETKEKSRIEEKKKTKEEDIEFVTVFSVGETPVELKWPKNIIKVTACEPRLQYSTNPKVVINSDDFKQLKERNKISEEIEKIRHFGTDNENGVKNEKLSTEYEKFMGELNPSHESRCVTEESRDLETKLREKLVKQMYDKKDEDLELMTSSERRAIEKMKKKGHNYDENVDNKKHDDLKSAPMSAYYSAKVQKSSPIHRSNESEKYESKSSKTNESENYHKMNEISLNISEQRSHSSHSSDKSHSKDRSHEEKKRTTTAKELLERVKQKKDSNKESKDSGERDDSHRSKRLPQTAKIPHKKWLSRAKSSSVTTANADSTQQAFVSQPMKLDMNFDYNWYYNYYMNSMYGLGQYPQVNDPSLTSAYYAQYSMATSYDYSQHDVTEWMTQRGLTLDTTNVLPQNDANTDESAVKSEELPTTVESSSNQLDSTLTSQKTIESNDQKDDSQAIDTKDNTMETDIKQQIGVVISTTHSDTPFNSDLFSESKSQTDSSLPPILSVNSQDMEMSGDNSPSPPPPPPPRPLMTTMISSEPLTLPNGEVLPVGTKQIVVHPYQTDDPNKFTADWYYSAFNAQNNSQTNTS